MSKCETCGNCSFWELNWANPFEGYCAARVETTDSQFKCEEYRAAKDENSSKTAQAAEASFGGMV